MSKSDTQPVLVSICTTFFNGGKFIHRLVDSSLNQTYKNIEVILVDDASDDNSQEIVTAYAARDSRVKYFRNTQRVGAAECFKKSVGLACGKFIVMAGSDDWLAQHFIENGLSVFDKYPEVAGIIPRLITLYENSPDEFLFLDDITLLSKIYPSEWFVRRVYKTSISVAAFVALMRRGDVLNFWDYFLKNLAHNYSLPEEMRLSCLNFALSNDNLIFVEVLRKYKTYLFDDSLVYFKIKQSERVSLSFYQQNSMSKLLEYQYYNLLTYQISYKLYWHNFYRKMKVYIGTEALSTIFIYFLRSGLRPPFLDISASKKVIGDFFTNFPPLEIVMVMVYLIPRIIYRFVSFLIRKIKQKIYPIKKIPPKIFVKENSLDSVGRFTV